MDAIADPFDRDMAWFSYLMRRRETTEAMQRLDEARKTPACKTSGSSPSDLTSRCSKKSGTPPKSA